MRLTTHEDEIFYTASTSSLRQTYSSWCFTYPLSNVLLHKRKRYLLPRSVFARRATRSLATNYLKANKDIEEVWLCC